MAGAAAWLRDARGFGWPACLEGVRRVSASRKGAHSNGLAGMVMIYDESKALRGVSMILKEAEKGIRYLCGMWAKERGISAPAGDSPARFHPSFSDFYRWVHEKHSTYLDFKTGMGVRYMVELWFDAEFKQRMR